MGRITIFTMDDCERCTTLRAAFDKRYIPYVEINLSMYPSRRKDMIAASNQLETPQVFFNDESMGGAEEILRILRKWDKDPDMSAMEVYDYTVAFATEPKNPRLCLPMTTSTSIPEVDENCRKFQSDWLTKHITTPIHHQIQEQCLLVQQPRPSSTSTSSSSKPSLSKQQTTSREGTSVLKITRVLQSILTREDLKYHMTTYKNSFRASHLIVAVGAYYHLSPDEALDFCQSLQSQYKILDHVCGDHIISNTDSLFFRLTCDQRPHILNSFRRWNLQSVDVGGRPSDFWGSIDTSSALELGDGLFVSDDDDVDNNNNDGAEEKVTSTCDYKYSQLLFRLNQFLSKILNDKTISGWVDYKKCVQHELYPLFEEAVCELQMIQLDRMSRPYQLAFCINLYNLMIKYAFIKVGIPPLSDTNKRSAFLSHVCIELGKGEIFSFHDLKHGILRNNRKPFHGSIPFGSSNPKDNRARFCMEQVDPRIHFALNCEGTSSHWFHGESIEEELQVMGQQFCNKDTNIQVDEAGHTVYLASLVQWYKDDFSDPGLLTSTNSSSRRTSSTSALPTSDGPGSNMVNVQSYLMEFLPPGKKKSVWTRMLHLARDGDRPPVKIQWIPYDGSCLANEFRPFTMNNIKADVNRFLPTIQSPTGRNKTTD